ncbi:MAG: hypothetical protein ACI9TV_000978 [Sulfurimonas sp.]|jgi:hypothetical protein|uniref:hypothetical protein n=1 Tax=Sulfurimonas sp. TaxID=2022749 RepID=UPI0039E3BA19
MSKVKELKVKVLEAQQNADIAAMYILQEEAHATFDEETLSGFFANILDLALENLTNTLESCSKFNINDVQDFATLRALYEYAMEHYHAGAMKDASALYEVLAGITNDEEFSLSLKYHYIAADKGISLEVFMDDYADMEKTQTNKTFYISCFKKKAQSLLVMKKSTAE